MLSLDTNNHNLPKQQTVLPPSPIKMKKTKSYEYQHDNDIIDPNNHQDYNNDFMKKLKQRYSNISI